MNDRVVLLAVLVVGTAACGIGDGAARPPVDSPVIPPDKIMDFAFLYRGNCSGCHGPDGKGGLALGLADPVYLAISNATNIRGITARGVPGTAMPAFAQSAGGPLTDRQIDALVNGIRTRWAKPGLLRDIASPPYAVDTPGDPRRGATVYEIYCSSCHGAAGRGGERAGSITDAAYLTLVSDQSLRTTVIAGRPDLGSPDWRGDVPNKPMSPEDVSDVVAWLTAQRPETQTQLTGKIQ